jgi:hypothetical protein
MEKINLDSMTEDELRHLNREIYRRLEYLSSLRRAEQLMTFRVGDQIEFDDGYAIVSGIITRINQKTASIQADVGRGWRVAPGLLRKVRSVEERPEVNGQKNLFHFPSGAGTRS